MNNNIFRTKVVYTHEDIKEGMMNKTFDNFDAMLFILNKKKEKTSFWMKNCIIPLDIIFISDNKITQIYHDCPPCIIKSIIKSTIKTETNLNKCERYPGNGNIVIEILGGTCKKLNIKEDDYVLFEKYNF